ncbi:glycosyltransferase family 1 protein, partial [Candidatus Desantisbacteria bacterium CG02_land_8_20_14_3_00_49_13]
LSSLNEGLPVAIIESMTAAKPVVATDVGGVRELVADGETGFVVPAKDPEALAKGVCAVLSDANKMKEMGRKARERAYPRYSIRRLISDIENLYEELIREKRLKI